MVVRSTAAIKARCRHRRQRPKQKRSPHAEANFGASKKGPPLVGKTWFWAIHQSRTYSIEDGFIHLILFVFAVPHPGGVVRTWWLFLSVAASESVVVAFDLLCRLQPSSVAAVPVILKHRTSQSRTDHRAEPPPAQTPHSSRASWAPGGDSHKPHTSLTLLPNPTDTERTR